MLRTLFLADQFSDAMRTRRDRHPGGAELTDAAAIAACPWPITLRKLSELSPGEVASYDVIVVGNSQSASAAQLAEIASVGRHVAFEHDLRVCRWRGNFVRAVDPWHRRQHRCWCPHPEAQAFFRNAAGVIFLTSFQERIYRQNPFFACGESRVLGSSLFDPAALQRAQAGRQAGGRSGTCIFASPHRIKGFHAAQRYCRDHQIQPTLIRGIAPDDVLGLFARSERFVYLPIGPEWAGRMVVEARLLGCEVIANDNVGVTGESFWRGSTDQAVEFLRRGPERFWSLVEELLNAPRKPLASGERGSAAAGAELLGRVLRTLPAWLMPLDAPKAEVRVNSAW